MHGRRDVAFGTKLDHRPSAIHDGSALLERSSNRLNLKAAVEPCLESRAARDERDALPTKALAIAARHPTKVQDIAFERQADCKMQMRKGKRKNGALC
jgi:hypothetical protein